MLYVHIRLEYLLNDKLTSILTQFHLYQGLVSTLLYLGCQCTGSSILFVVPWRRVIMVEFLCCFSPYHIVACFPDNTASLGEKEKQSVEF